MANNEPFRVRPPKVDKLGISPSSAELAAYVSSKYGPLEKMGPSPRLRYTHRYISADDLYEATVFQLVQETTRWLDVGCGRDIFPSNFEGAKTLSERAALLVGVDPDENIHANDLLSERFQSSLEELSTSETFDLITLRMVAEHVQQPARCARKLAELTSPGGLVVVYTPWKWAPMSVFASVIPYSFHNPLKRIIWNTEERDTFPTAYLMNTRRTLQALFSDAGFDEVFFCHADDCSVTQNFLNLNTLEILLRNTLYHLRVTYPENCLLAAFQRL